MNRKRAHVLVIGNTKGGTGKSTVAMHLIVEFLRRGQSVASIDMDTKQGTLSRYIENRRVHMEARGRDLPMPDHFVAYSPDDTEPEAKRSRDEGSFLDEMSRMMHENRTAAHTEQKERFVALISDLMTANDIIVVDTPGADTFLNRLAHTFADTLITPLNDSFVDLDVLARINGQSLRIERPSRYAEMVWEQKVKRASEQRSSIDWIVMRNRLSSLDAKNKRAVEQALHELSQRFGIRTVPGFGERVIFRELFPMGLTMMDLEADDMEFNISHVAARQEVRSLVNAIRMT